MKIYIVLRWFWEGDGYLISSYKDCFKSLDESLKSCKESGLKTYLPSEEITEEHEGHYNFSSFLQIIEKEL